MKTVPFVLLSFSFFFGGGKDAAASEEFTLERVQGVYKTMEITQSGIYEKDGIVFAAFAGEISGRKNLELDSIGLANVYAMLRAKFGLKPPFRIKYKNVINTKSDLTGKFLYVNAYQLKDLKDLKAAQDLRARQAAQAEAQRQNVQPAQTAPKGADEAEPPERAKPANLAYGDSNSESPAERGGSAGDSETAQQPAREQPENTQTPAAAQPSAPEPHIMRVKSL